MLLGFNIDHIATLRQARGERYPSPIEGALVAESSGADNITLHLREDRRHIQDDDVMILRRVIKTRMNLEIALTEEMIDFALRVRPHEVCIVPERREELTTEGGLNLNLNQDFLRLSIERLKGSDIFVSLFIDPEIKSVSMADKLGADAIELHTGKYASSYECFRIAPVIRDCKNDFLSELDRLKMAASLGEEFDLIVNAGHGLNYHNVGEIVNLGTFQTLNIGHSIVSRSIFSGLPRAIRDMKALLSASDSQRNHAPSGPR